MSRMNGIHIPPSAHVGSGQPIVTAMNDLQLIALIAANLLRSGVATTPRESVQTAIQIIAEAAVQLPTLGQAVRDKQDALRAAPEG